MLRRSRRVITPEEAELQQRQAAQKAAAPKASLLSRLRLKPMAGYQRSTVEPAQTVASPLPHQPAREQSPTLVDATADAAGQFPVTTLPASTQPAAVASQSVPSTLVPPTGGGVSPPGTTFPVIPENSSEETTRLAQAPVKTIETTLGQPKPPGARKKSTRAIRTSADVLSKYTLETSAEE